MKILITGGAGYLGSILIRKLLEKNYKVKILDNFLYGKNSIEGLNIPYIVGDIRDIRVLVEAIKDIDVVVHLASIVGAQAADLDRKTTMQINYLSTKNLIELCKLYDVKKIIFASTCSVYGAQPNILIKENNELKPVDFYAQTKVMCEKAIKNAQINSCILRLGTLFGYSYRMRFDLAINLFIAKAALNEKIEVFGGAQTRPFLHVQDAAEAIIFAIENNLQGTFNAHWENWKIIDIVKDLENFFPVKAEISKTIIDRRNYAVSSEKINKKGFKAKKDFRFAVDELKDKMELLKNYTNPIYSNYSSLFKNEEVKKKVYTMGPI